MPRKIAVITGTRAEYGLLQLLLKEIVADPALTLQLMVTGSHLSPQHGLTLEAIEKDGFTVTAKIPILSEKDSPYDILLAMSRAIAGFADAFSKHEPDLVVVLGDRYEILAACIGCMILKIPIAHIHGGEITEGAVDEAIRHSITKMSHLHFVACEEYRHRVIQLGESPATVFNFGAMGTEVIKHLAFLSKAEVEKRLGFSMKNPTFLVTYHPVTLSQVSPTVPFRELLQAFDEFPEANIIFTRSNADSDSSLIHQQMNEFVAQNKSRAMAATSLGQLLYLSTMRYSSVVIGNSSSGIIEAPALRVPTVNIGPRQSGRIKAESILDCPERSEEMILAVKKALSVDFKLKVNQMIPPYGEENSSQLIKDKLKSYPLEGLLMKKFYDLPHLPRDKKKDTV